MHHTDGLICTSDGEKKEKEAPTHLKVLRFVISLVAYALLDDYPTVITKLLTAIVAGMRVILIVCALVSVFLLCCLY